MRKVTEIAKEVGVSRQAIYQRIDKLTVKQVKQFIRKGKRGETLVTVSGEEYFKQCFCQVELSTLDNHVDKYVDNDPEETITREGFQDLNLYREMVDNFKKQVDTLQKEKERLELKLEKKEELLNEKDQQIKDYFVMLAQMNGEVKKLQAASENAAAEKEVIEHKIVQQEKKPLFARLVDTFKGE